jgi:hypothetical protein
MMGLMNAGKLEFHQTGRVSLGNMNRPIWIGCQQQLLASTTLPFCATLILLAWAKEKTSMMKEGPDDCILNPRKVWLK